VSEPRRGEVWWAEFPEVGRRPFLILTRDVVIPLLTALVCAPITRTVRGIPSALPLGIDDGMPEECAANFDNLYTVPKAMMTGRICSLSLNRRLEMCRALRIAVDC
jgi:mRNA interferase MazF